MNNKEFNKKDLKSYLPESFKGLSKKYIMDCIFNEKIQEKWKPTIGDIIVGCTGNIWVVSNEDILHPDLGGTLYFFGGNMCTRDDSNFLTETICYTMNESGKWFTWSKDGIVEEENMYHSSYKNFRFVPYPHEFDRF